MVRTSLLCYGLLWTTRGGQSLVVAPALRRRTIPQIKPFRYPLLLAGRHGLCLYRNFQPRHPLTTTTTTTIATARRCSSTASDDKDNTNKDDDNGPPNTLFLFELPPHLPRTVQNVLLESVQWLESIPVDEPESSATQLLAHALHLPWSNGFVQLQQLLLLQQQQEQLHSTTNHSSPLSSRLLTSTEYRHYQRLLQRRAHHHEPLQYILGQWDFLDYTFHVRPPLLCPRPETEELVELVRKDVVELIQQKFQSQKKITNQSTPPPPPTMRILDVGVGTGAIGVSLAAMLRHQNNNNKHAVSVVGIDVEPVAIETSLDNARRILGDYDDDNDDISTTLYTATLASAADYHSNVKFDVVVSNPPYIPEDDMDALSKTVLLHESRTALCGGGRDGMKVICDIVRRLPDWCRRRRPGGGAVCWMEVDPSQPALLQEWLLEEEMEEKVVLESTHKDMYGRDRFVKLRVL